MKLTSREVLYHYQLKDLVSMENQIENAIESLADAATNEQLKQAFESHHQETKEQLKQVQKLLEAAGKTARGRRCKGIESILTEGEEAANSTGKDTDAKDAALIAAARSVEHYETAAYLAAIDSARTLGLSEDQRTLTEIMHQEAETDRKLAAISQQITIANTEDDAEGGVPSSDSPVLERSQPMTPHTQYDQQQGNYQGREYGGHRSAQMQDRDDQGRFTGYSGSPQNQGYNQGQQQGNYNQGGGNYGNPNYQNEGNFGGYQGRAEGGQHSAQMQGRDEQGQFTGYQGGQANYNPNYSQGGYGQGGYNQGGYNQGQSMGGQHSAQMQGRDDQGQFTGYRDSPQHQGQYQGNYNQSGQNYGHPNDQNQGDFGGYQGRAEGGHHSAQMQNRDEQGRFTGYQGGQGNYGGQGGYSQGGYQGGNYGNPGGNYGGSQGAYNQGGYQSGRGGITDSAGRHYTQESWEAAQRGRSLGGQHSHGGGGNYR